jgi:hypothetical protein
MKTVILDGEHLTLEQVLEVAEGKVIGVGSLHIMGRDLAEVRSLGEWVPEPGKPRGP